MTRSYSDVLFDATERFYAEPGMRPVPAMPGKFCITDAGSMLMIIGWWTQDDRQHELCMLIRTSGEFQFVHDSKPLKKGEKS